MADIKSRYAGEWAATDPILRKGEPGFDRTVAKLKMGDGKKRWSELPYLLDVAGPSEEELRAAFVPVEQGRPRGNVAVVIGDSNIASVADGDPMRVGHNFFNLFCARTRQRIRYGGYFATGGMTAEDVFGVQLPKVLAMDPLPSACVILAGTNNLGALDLGTLAPLWEDGVAALRAVGIVPIVCTIPPRDTSGGVVAVSQFNSWITDFAARNGLPLFPVHTALVDPVTGYYKSGYSGDGIHFAGASARVVADYAAARGMHELFLPNPAYTAKSAADGTNLLVNGVFIGDDNADGHANSWTGTSATNVTRSLVAPTADDDLAGNWQQLVRAPGGATQGYLTQVIAASSAWAVGDRLALSGRVQSSGFEGSSSTFSVQVGFTGATGSHNLEAIYAWKVDLADGTFYAEGVIPAGTTAMLFSALSAAPAAGSTTLRLGELTLRNLTQLGLA